MFPQSIFPFQYIIKLRKIDEKNIKKCLKLKCVAFFYYAYIRNSVFCSENFRMSIYLTNVKSHPGKNIHF